MLLVAIMGSPLKLFTGSPFSEIKATSNNEVAACCKLANANISATPVTIEAVQCVYNKMPTFICRLFDSYIKTSHCCVPFFPALPAIHPNVQQPILYLS